MPQPSRRDRDRHLPPGEISLRPGEPEPKVNVFVYDADTLDELPTADVATIRDALAPGKVVWVDVQGLGDGRLLKEFAEQFSLHRLAIEDVVHSPQRPKADPYEDNLLFITRQVRFIQAELVTEQVSLFLGPGWVITFQEKYGDCLDPVRERLRGGLGQVRRMEADYLAYCILDAIVDGYYPVLEHYGELLEQTEADILAEPDPALLARINRTKRELLGLRRAVFAHREALNALLRDDSPFFAEGVRVYLRDVYDHNVQIMESLEMYRELASGLTDTYMSAMSNKMNEVMKVLTIIATVFIPLSFLAGVYGMNFDPSLPGNLPELHTPYAYVGFWIAAACLAGGMLIYFRRKKWL